MCTFLCVDVSESPNKRAFKSLTSLIFLSFSNQVSHASVGLITEVSDGRLEIDFPEQSGWSARTRDVERVTADGEPLPTADDSDGSGNSSGDSDDSDMEDSDDSDTSSGTW